MQGQKQLFSFIVIMIFVFAFSFYKSSIKNDNRLRPIREDELRIRLESSALQLAKKDKLSELKRQLHEKYLQKLLEHKDICYDIHAIIFKPDRNSIEESTNANDNIKVQNGKWKEVVDQTADTKSKNSVITGPLIYMCVIVLIGSLVKAAMDISNQLKKNSDEDAIDPRRCSLQEYANNNKRDRRSTRAPSLRRATTITMEPRLSPKHHSLDERRFSYAIPDFNNGLITEPGTPAKSVNGIASRPAPLLRRCSVPAFALQQAGHGSKLRRPSMDSFSEDDSSPDVKRRVRMIHRH